MPARIRSGIQNLCGDARLPVVSPVVLERRNVGKQILALLHSGSLHKASDLGLRIVVIVVGVTDCLITTDIASEFLISIGWHCCKGKGGDGGKCCNRLARHGDI